MESRFLEVTLGKLLKNIFVELLILDGGYSGFEYDSDEYTLLDYIQVGKRKK